MDQHTETYLLASPEASGRVVRCPAIGAPAFLADLAARSAEAGESIRLDLSDRSIELDFMTIQALILLARELQRYNLELSLVGCDDDRQKRLRCGGAAQLMTIASSHGQRETAENFLMATAT
jgi:hypothetical protein